MRGREYAVEYWGMEPTGDLRACEKHAHTHLGVVNMTSFLWWAGTQSPRGENRALICNVCYLCGVITLTMADFRLLVSHSTTGCHSPLEPLPHSFNKTALQNWDDYSIRQKRLRESRFRVTRGGGGKVRGLLTPSSLWLADSK